MTFFPVLIFLPKRTTSIFEGYPITLFLNSKYDSVNSYSLRLGITSFLLSTLKKNNKAQSEEEWRVVIFFNSSPVPEHAI